MAPAWPIALALAAQPVTPDVAGSGAGAPSRATTSRRATDGGGAADGSSVAAPSRADGPAPAPQRPRGWTPARAEPAPTSDAPAREPTRISAAILLADEFDRAELGRALQLRLPALAISGAGEDPPPPPPGSLRAFIELRRTAPARVQLTLILADGRAYVRGVDVDPDAPARPVAGALANLIAAIEDDTAVPDRKDAPVPPALVAAPPAAEPPRPSPVLEDSPVPRPPPAAPAPAPPRWELGPSLRLGATLGLAPPSSGLHGLGAGLGLDARARAGLLLAVDLQALARPAGAYLLTRARVAVGAGWALRRGGFELPVVALLGVEPWRLRRDGEHVALQAEAGSPRPLLGLGLRVAPGLAAAVAPGVRLRVGLRAELWASGEPRRGGLRRAELQLPDGTALGLGGPELHLGLEVGLWFPPGRPRRPARGR